MTRFDAAIGVTLILAIAALSLMIRELWRTRAALDAVHSAPRDFHFPCNRCGGSGEEPPR